MVDHAVGADCATVIGSDVCIKGEISVEKGLRIDGQIEGAVITKGKVLVGKSGQLKAEVRAGVVVVEGRITGNVTAADRVQIDASGQVFGDLTAGKLVVAEGATFAGKVNVGPEAVKNVELPKSDDELPAPVASRIGGLASVLGGNGRK